MSESNIEILGEGVTRESLHDGQLLVYKVTDARRETVDAWMNAMIKTIESSPPNRRYFTLYDVGYREMAFTPYLRKGFEELTRRFPNTTGCTAIRMRHTVVARIARLFIEHEMQRRHKTQTIRIFFDRDEALAWLEEELRKAE